MKLKHLSLLLCLVMTFYQCTFTQDSIGNSDDNYTVDRPDFEDGKCYAKCMVPDEYETYYEHYPVYTGDQSTETVELETITIEMTPASTKWVKKKADKNCMSADPNDCLVWCLVEAPSVVETLTILKDTTQSTNYKVKEIPVQELVKEGGFLEWREVVCHNKITPSLVHQIQNALRAGDYFEGENTRSMNQDTKAALTRFQKDNRLPIGNLDNETLGFLGIDVNF